MDFRNADGTSRDNVRKSSYNRGILQTIGTVILLAGAAILAYGAAGFWLMPTLPPNGGVNGRLPSLYVLAGGMAVAFVGLVVRGFRVGSQNTIRANSRQGIPALYGILALVAILILFIWVVSRL